MCQCYTIGDNSLPGHCYDSYTFPLGMMRDCFPPLTAYLLPSDDTEGNTKEDGEVNDTMDM